MNEHRPPSVLSLREVGLIIAKAFAVHGDKFLKACDQEITRRKALDEPQLYINIWEGPRDALMDAFRLVEEWVLAEAREPGSGEVLPLIADDPLVGPVFRSVTETVRQRIANGECFSGLDIDVENRQAALRELDAVEGKVVLITKVEGINPDNLAEQRACSPPALARVRTGVWNVEPWLRSLYCQPVYLVELLEPHPAVNDFQYLDDLRVNGTWRTAYGTITPAEFTLAPPEMQAKYADAPVVIPGAAAEPADPVGAYLPGNYGALGQDPKL